MTWRSGGLQPPSATRVLTTHGRMNTRAAMPHTLALRCANTVSRTILRACTVATCARRRAPRPRRRPWAVVKTVGNSMAPTLRDGDLVLAVRARRTLRTGDVIVFALPAHAAGGGHGPAWRVKRIAAVAGDETPSWLQDASSPTQRARIPHGFVVVRGDARSSQDSRQLGLIDEALAVGVVRWRRTNGLRWHSLDS